MKFSTESALNWEAEADAQKARSVKVAWTVAGLSLIVTVAAIATMASVMPLKETAVHVVVLDKNNGSIQPINLLGQNLTLPDAVVKKLVSDYVTDRESYFYPLLQKQYDNVLAMSSNAEGNKYSQIFIGPDRKDQLLKNDVEDVVRILSVTFPPDEKKNKAVVRFELKRRQVGNLAATTAPKTFAANIAYSFDSRILGGAQIKGLSEIDALRNPLGFKVTAYRRDEEIGQSATDGAAPTPAEPVAQ